MILIIISRLSRWRWPQLGHDDCPAHATQLNITIFLRPHPLWQQQKYVRLGLSKKFTLRYGSHIVAALPASESHKVLKMSARRGKILKLPLF